MKLLVLALCVASAFGSATELTKENYKGLVTDSGKNAFVKFLAPWCGHCKSMKPAWDQLGAEYAESTSVVIGDADCTASGQELCTDFGVQGYPTIKYFTEETGEKGSDYQGGRDFASLKKFVDDTLEVKCVVEDPKGCTEKETGYIAKMKAKGADAVAKQIARLEKMKAGQMKAELKQWVNQRYAILKQL